MRPNAVVIAGPSGVGKGTLIGKLQAEFPKLFGFSVSHTTRPPRKGEEDGVHYNFTTVDKLLAEVKDGKFIEHAEVHGKYYGTSVAAVEKVQEQGKICILDIDVQGCQSARAKGLAAKYLFIAPPSMNSLEQRLRGRGTETEEAIVTRLNNAKKEMEHKDDEQLFDAVVVNDDLERAYVELKTLIQEDLTAAQHALGV